MNNTFYHHQGLFDKLVYLRDLIISWFLKQKILLMKISIILGVMVGTVLMSVGMAKYTFLFGGLMVLPIAFFAVEYIVRHFELFPVIILIVAAFVPLSLPTGTGSNLVFSLVMTMLFFGIWIMRMIAVDKHFSLQPSHLNIPIIAFMIVTAISLIWSNLFRDPMVITWRSFPFVQAASTVVMIMLPMALLLVANHIKKEKTLKLMVGIMIVAGVVGIPRQFFYLRAVPINTGGMYNMWVILLSAALGLYHNGLSKATRTALLGLAGLWVYWGVGMHISWLAGWLPGLFGLGIIIWRRSKKLVLLAAFAAAIFLTINFSSVYSYVSETVAAERAESGESRLEAWAVNWRVTREHWLFGTGPAGYAAYYMTYYPLEGTASHSNYVDIIAQTGVIGLSLALWMFFGLALLGYRLSVRLRGRGDFLEATANAAMAGTLGCILMMAFGDWLFPFAYTQSIEGFDYAVYNWLFMGTLLVIERITKKPQEKMAA